jgi:large subunit ribosomal protein L10
MNQAEKQQEVEYLGEVIGQSANAFLLDFKGLNVERSTDLRIKLREKEGRLRIVKNRLAKRAFAEGSLELIEGDFVGQTAIAYPLGNDVVAVAKVLRDFSEEHELAPVKAGVVEGRAITPEEFATLADLPSREELIAKALYLMKYPVTGLVTTLNGVLRNVVVVLDAVRQQKESE